MNIAPYALVGAAARREEALRRLATEPAYLGELPPSDLQRYRLLIDLNLDDHPGRLDRYRQQPHLCVLGCAVKRSLLDMMASHADSPQCQLLGLNALPGFLDRPRWEVSYIGETEKNLISDLQVALGQDLEPVQDAVGMVAPRVLFLIINEAFVVEQEGTATAADVDTAMRLGTNYPLGPFEWAARVGYQQIIDTLEALHAATGDSRFVPAKGLRRAAQVGR